MVSTYQGVTVKPLVGIRVIELESLAPAPFAGMMLADMGAEVTCVRRPRQEPATWVDPLSRGKVDVTVDLKDAPGRDTVRDLVYDADVFIEGFRPGVTERLGLGPEDLFAVNPCLVYGRMTGWGQTGPLADRAGHDINYIAISGALEPIGRAGERPVPPLNLVGDFGGGGMLLVVGLLAALFDRNRSGSGLVVDAAMVDGSALLTTFLHGRSAAGAWGGPRGTNLLDGGAPFYDTYETADGKYVAVGAIEGRFWRHLVATLGLDPDTLPDRLDRASWPTLRYLLAEAFKLRTRDEWAVAFHDVDACVTPVLSPSEAAAHPHALSRGSFQSIDGLMQPAPAPRFGRPSVAN
jgi:alpha-methylacyl-CoA racemase